MSERCRYAFEEGHYAGNCPLYDSRFNLGIQTLSDDYRERVCENGEGFAPLGGRQCPYAALVQDFRLQPLTNR